MVVLLALIVGAALLGLALPEQATVVRSIRIERPPATVFTVLNGYRHFDAWSPWARLDPAMTTRIEAAPSGVGARYAWASEQAAVGSGSQEIIESVPYERISVRLAFSGMDADNRAEFALRPEGTGTELSWTLVSSFGMDIVGRYLGLLLDAMVGPDQERGLAQLKAHVESLPAVDFSGLVVELLEVDAQPIAYVSGRTSTNPEAIAQAYEQAYARLSAVLARERVEPAGPVLAIGRRWDTDRGLYEFEAAIPVPAGTAALRTDHQVRLGQTYAGHVLRAAHRGPQDAHGAHLQQLMAYKQAAGFESNGAPWDVYVRNGGADRVTETYVPVR